MAYLESAIFQIEKTGFTFPSLLIAEIKNILKLKLQNKNYKINANW